MRTRRRAFGLFIVALGGTALVAAAQSGGSVQPPQKPPVFRTEANFVRVDVYPMKDGQPVLDLTAAEFEVFEDGVPQKIETFEHVQVRPARSQPARDEPSSQRESLQEAANPRHRVFVIFLDKSFVSIPGAHTINVPLIRLIDSILGPDDVVGVMTPEMAASQLVLARKTQVIEDSLRTNWAWGSRFSTDRDEREMAYEACYGVRSALAAEMIARKRERTTLEALDDLVNYLHGIREERKAILTVTEGWLLFRENRALMNLRKGEEPPGRDPIVVGPTGQPGIKDPRQQTEGSLTKRECDTDRMRLASMDNERFMRDLVDNANRANASFYMIDPRGLPVVDTPAGPREEHLPPLRDAASLRTRREAMRILSLNTDGIAVMDGNDLDAGLKRISDDLTSYYLLGYYSTNAKPDGRLRRITVRVKRDDVEVRARRGYRALTSEEVASARRTADGPAPSAADRAMRSALGALSRIGPDVPFRVNASALAGADTTTVWVAGELLPAATRNLPLAAGASAEVEVTSGTSLQSTSVTLEPGQKTFLTQVNLPGGKHERIDVHARLSLDAAAAPVTDAIEIAADLTAARPLLYRRGPSTANRIVAAADPRFSRSDRVRLEIPLAAGAKAGVGRLLDRTGQPLKVPVMVSEKTDDATGQHWLIADITLAALAPGDYVIEIGTMSDSAEVKALTAIRVAR